MPEPGESLTLTFAFLHLRFLSKRLTGEAEHNSSTEPHKESHLYYYLTLTNNLLWWFSVNWWCIG